MKIKLIVDGGSMKPGPAVSQQLGPMGINIGKVIQDVNEATIGFKGMKVPVELNIDKNTKEFTIEVSSPPVSELIKKELKLEKASGKSGSVWVGNISVEQLIGIAKTKMSDMLAKDLKAGLKLVVGSCTSSGVLVDNKNPKEIIQDINSGVYDSEIKEEKVEPSEDKIKNLESQFAIIKAKQDKDLKALEEAKAKEEEEKAAAATEDKEPAGKVEEKPQEGKK